MNNERPKVSHRIFLLWEFDEWYWSYRIGKTEMAISSRTYGTVARARNSAISFRKLLATADICEIVEPLNG